MSELDVVVLVSSNLLNLLKKLANARAREGLADGGIAADAPKGGEAVMHRALCATSTTFPAAWNM